MVIYIEYAFIVNFLLDGALIYLALRLSKANLKMWRVFLAAAIGAAEALIFPLFTLPVWCASLIKFLGGILLSVIAVSRGSLKTYCLVPAIFFILTFLLGGFLTAFYSYLSIPYENGKGFLLEGAPISLVLAAAAVFAIVTVRFANSFYRYRRLRRNLFSCKLKTQEGEIKIKALADSGNCLSFHGSPVCVLSPLGALALFRKSEPVGRMIVSTVNGSREAPVFECEMQLMNRTRTCYITVGETASKEYQLILHTALLEDVHERIQCFKGMAEKIRGK